MNKQAMHLFFALSLGFAGLILAGQAVFAAPQNCAPRAQVLERLTTHFKETLHAMGLTSNKTIMELYASEATGTWSLLATSPNGITCLVTSGEYFERHQSPLPPVGIPS